MKSLVLGYFSTPVDKKHEVERLLARILDFNQDEMTKAKLHFGSSRRPSQSEPEKKEGLAALFVQFLQTESKREVNGVAQMASPSIRELAKDYAKFNMEQDKEMKSNPFLAAASSPTGSPALSTASSTSSMNNQLLYQIDTKKPTSIQPFIVNANNENTPIFPSK